MGESFFHLIAAFVGTVSFAVLFGTPSRYLMPCGMVGFLGWAVYLAVGSWYGSPAVAVFVASTVLTICYRYLARFYKATTTLFLTSGIFTLVPGAGIYYTAHYTIIGDTQTALSYGLSSFKTAVAIGLGIGVAYCLSPRLFGWHKEAEIWKESGAAGQKEQEG